MSDTNRTRISITPESTYGETPASPAFETLRVTSGQLSAQPRTVTSNEFRSDRQVTDLVLVGEEAGGDIGFEVSYGAQDTLLEAAMSSTWQNKPVIENSAPDTEITAVTDSSNTYSVASGGADFKAGHLVRATDFTNSNNNRIFRVGSSTGTTVVGPAMTLTDEAAPPEGAKLQVVGFQGASGDLEAVIATGGNDAEITSTLLDFTTLGLHAGEWLKVGGSATIDKFSTAANNDWVRISTIAAHVLSLDIVPSGWANNTGSAKTIKFWCGDYVRNGVTERSFTIERQFTDHSPVTYEYLRGMEVDQMSFSLDAQAIATGTVRFLGNDSVMQDSGRFASASDIEPPTNDVLNTSSNVGRIGFDGDDVGTPNFVLAVGITFANNLRRQTAIGSIGAIGIGQGEFNANGSIRTYFGDKTIAQNVINNTSLSLDVRLERSDSNGQTLLIDLPRMKLSSGAPEVPGKNQDVLINANYQAFRHETLGYTAQAQRFVYTE